MKSSNNFDAPPPTKAELLVRKILRANNIHFTIGEVIWYSESDMFTPDLIIGRKGKKLIVEVDGKIHDKDHRKTLDRIRQRALENMGYKVFRVKNEEVQRKPNVVAEKIMGEYSQLIDSDNKKGIKITELEKPLKYESISSKIDDKLQDWVVEFNAKLNDERWSVGFFKKELSQYDPNLIKNKSVMENVILQLHGLNLHKMDDGNLDFKYSLLFFKKGIDLLNEMFDKDDKISIHLKNQFNKTTANFFKNLIFKGGPRIRKGLVSINDKDSLNYHIDNFNKNLSELGINVERSAIKQECKAELQKLNKAKQKHYNWLMEWMKNPN